MTCSSSHWRGDAPLPVPLATRIEGLDTGAFPGPGEIRSYRGGVFTSRMPPRWRRGLPRGTLGRASEASRQPTRKALARHGGVAGASAAERYAVCHPLPDFFYREASAAIYVDGPPHDAPDQVREDEARTRALIEFGYIVIRLHHGADWPVVLRPHPDLFGALNGRSMLGILARQAGLHGPIHPPNPHRR